MVGFRVPWDPLKKTPWTPHFFSIISPSFGISKNKQSLKPPPPRVSVEATKGCLLTINTKFRKGIKENTSTSGKYIKFDQIFSAIVLSKGGH